MIRPSVSRDAHVQPNIALHLMLCTPQKGHQLFEKSPKRKRLTLGEECFCRRQSYKVSGELLQASKGTCYATL